MVQLNRSQDSDGWDSRAGTLTFHTFRPSTSEGPFVQGLLLNDPCPDSPIKHSSVKQQREAIVFNVQISLPRFAQQPVGFSVCGGKDEQCAVFVNNVVPGAPADKAGLALGDEILEVNGIALDQATHAEVVEHMQRCIQTRALQLKVKRKSTNANQGTTSGPTASVADLPNGRVSEAYLVAGTPQQRAHLQAQLKHQHPGVRAVDMTSEASAGGSSPLMHNGHAKPHANGHTMVQTAGVAETSFAQAAPHVSNGALSTFKAPVSNLAAMPVSRIGVAESANGYEHAAPGGQNGSGQNGGAIDPSRLERLRKYEDELRKRREAENKATKEQEFLRTSLRGSKKLQALEKQSQPVYNSLNTLPVHAEAHANDAFILETPSPSAASNTFHDQDDVIGLQDILLSVHRVSEALEAIPEHRKDAEFLRALFAQQEVQNAAKVTAAVQGRGTRRPVGGPTIDEAFAVTDGVLKQLYDSISDKSGDLQNILLSPHFQALLYAHDKIAHKSNDQPTSTARLNGDVYFGLKETVFDEQPTSGSIRIIRLWKERDLPLGATIKTEDGRIVIGRIVRGGVAEKSGLLHECDELLEVNGISLHGKTVNEVCDVLASMVGELTFVVVPTQQTTPKTASPPAVVKHMRAFFDYDPEDDPYVPCRELGLNFARGDVLHVINVKDPNWWQAYREGEEHPLAGLIPSATFQSQREQYNKEMEHPEDGKENKDRGAFFCAKKRRSRKGKFAGVSEDEQPVDSVDEVVVPYEEVTMYMSRTGRKRPVVLIGPPNVGCLELRQRLMEADKDHFAGVVPHTSRPRRAGEQDGLHYWFVSRLNFQNDVAQGNFIEWGEFQKHYYGTSVDAIRNVVERGKTCVLTLRAQSLKAIRATTLMPYIVFIAPPSMERLRQNRIKQGALGVKDEELKAILQEGRETEEKYGHYFDKVIVNFELDKTYQELRAAIHKLETEPQWVPLAWVQAQVSNGGSKKDS